MNIATAGSSLELPPFYHPVYFERLASTNDEAKHRAEEGTPEGLLIVAAEQTQGRGRRGRGWASPPGNLYCSLLLRPRVPPAEAALAGFCAALAIAESVGHFARRPEVRLKWPNDVLVAGAKVSGILLEASSSGGAAVDWLVIGMGVNLANKPEGVGIAVTCLAEHCPAPTATDFLSSLAPNLLAWLERLRAEGFAPVRGAWLAAAQGLGERVQARLPAETINGIFRELDDRGGLIMDLDGGGRRVIQSGEVFFPPADLSGSACC